MKTAARFILSLFAASFIATLSLAAEPGLLFYVSGDGPGDGFTADYAYGDPEPAYLNEYTIVPDGAVGRAFSAPHSEEKLMSYLAPGNIYSQRGTVSFYIRLRDDVGGMPFKLFYVSYSDQSSLDMTWLRVDYNGDRGFDAFATDADMARIRVSYKPDRFPAPGDWTHFAFSWDETKGVRFYMNGRIVAKKDTSSVFDAGLGLFQPFGRFSTTGTVTSNCGHLRGGDIDEIRIYESMLTDDQVASLAQGKPVAAAYPSRNLSDPDYRGEWLLRYGLNRTGDLPPALDGATAWSIRKVEIHDAYDQKKWGWRANDGIRETTWPDVYNRSSLLGRSDYFIEPDWYCYSTSGKSILFTLPDEQWNYCELTGAAFGAVSLISTDSERRTTQENTIFKRPAGQERTFHRFTSERKGGQLRFTNDVRETPLAEFNVFDIVPGSEPSGTHTLSYTLNSKVDPGAYPALDELTGWIDRRYPPDERAMIVGLPSGAPPKPRAGTAGASLPVVHALIPCQFMDEGPRTNAGAYGGNHFTWLNMERGLDGVAIDLPGIDLPAFADGLIPLNIKIKDPLWPSRSLIDVSLSVRPNESKTIWFDTRDRILDGEHSLYITFASACPGFGIDDLEGTRVRMVFKSREKAIAEHERDRFTQIRDLFGADISETFPRRRKLEHMERLYRDLTSLFAVNPHHIPGRYYWSSLNPEQGWPEFDQPVPPAGVPLWAFRQTEILRQWKYFLNWWINNRQIENGEFGGGLSDDGDFANCMPPLALMGVETDKITDSVRRLMDAYYNNGMFTNGLNTILTDALHATEEGINVQSELFLLDYGGPKIIERMMETASRIPDVTGINTSGHRHFRSSFLSSTKMATENPWCWSSRYATTILSPGMALVEFNNSPNVLKLIREVGDGYLAHARTDERGSRAIPAEINYLTDETRSFSTGTASQMFNALYRWTGDKKYVAHLGGPRTVGATRTIDKSALAESYTGTIQYNEQRMYMATEGFPWDDGPYISYGSVVDERLGGWPIRRGAQFPEHAVSWTIDPPFDGTSVAILVPSPTRTSVKIIGYNVEKDPVTCHVAGWDAEPGMWEITEGIDTNGDDSADGKTVTRTAAFERTQDVEIVFPSRKTYVVTMTLKKKGKPYSGRPDLAIGAEDVILRGNTVEVKVHSLGAAASPASSVSIVAEDGKTVASTAIPALEAPIDLKPKTHAVTLTLPQGTNTRGLRIVLDPDNAITELTEKNNVATLSGR